MEEDLKNNNIEGEATALDFESVMKKEPEKSANLTLNIEMLMGVGAQFGHKVKFTHPTMKPYIFDSANGFAIIHLDKTLAKIQESCKYIETVVRKGGKILWVGTKKNIQEIVAECAKRSGGYFVNQRWAPGLLTNFSTLQNTLNNKHVLKRNIESTKLYTKKEIGMMKRKLSNKERDYGGLDNMSGLPSCIVVLDASRQKIAIREANRLKIPIIAICDSITDIKEIDFPIPANDAAKSVLLISKHLSDFAVSGVKQIAKPAFTQKTDVLKFREGKEQPRRFSTGGKNERRILSNNKGNRFTYNRFKTGGADPVSTPVENKES